ncbi:S-adenosyl-L-methionine-dependent methyltransferase [Rhodotorula diobovata]|uniref:Protein arginine methyltransferase NDUFAF7 n=1 Tax=Rhodotorula diobovata TaxID=5288 RepID=A0A5C5FMW0_9BASI|nr:S-adenosyl-L-methionine-dependent methyltransferase [Rhodotorula diobovata]
MQPVQRASRLLGAVRRSATATASAPASQAPRRANSTYRPPTPPSAPRPSVKQVGESRPDRAAAPAAPSSTAQAPSSPSNAPSRPSPSELLTVLEETIKTHGPLPVPRFMTLCLNHPTLGYYTTRTVFGKEGDFVTSPEISQVFGELLAIWYVTQWLAQGSPKRVRVVELGPGRGTLLADILRTFRALPPQSRPPVSSIHLVEQSDQLKAVQKARLVETGFGETPVEWHADVKGVPHSDDEFTVLIAHEFFDALPVHIFENTQKGWREVLVDIADPKAIVASPTKHEPLRLVLAPGATPASALYTSLAQAAFPGIVQRGHLQPDLHPAAAPAGKSPLTLNVDTTLGASPPSPSPTPSPSPSPAPASTPASSTPPPATSLTAQRFARLPIGSRIEVSPASWEVARDTARLVGGPAGGAGLVVDYGDAKAFGRSWRGFRKHQVVDPLTEPGHTDLTANVDFSYLAESMSEFATTHGPLPQSRFLTSLGLEPRLAGLLRGASSDARRREIESAAKRLVDVGGMGSQYKVMAVTPKGAKDVFPFDLE